MAERFAVGCTPVDARTVTQDIMNACSMTPATLVSNPWNPSYLVEVWGPNVKIIDDAIQPSLACPYAYKGVYDSRWLQPSASQRLRLDCVSDLLLQPEMRIMDLATREVHDISMCQMDNVDALLVAQVKGNPLLLFLK